MEMLKTKKRIDEEYLRQGFHQHVQSNGELIMVSDDFQYYYIPKDEECVGLWKEFARVP